MWFDFAFSRFPLMKLKVSSTTFEVNFRRALCSIFLAMSPGVR